MSRPRRPLQIEIRPSRWLLGVLSLLHVTAAIAPWISTLTLLPCLLLNGVALVSLVLAIIRYQRQVTLWLTRDHLGWSIRQSVNGENDKRPPQFITLIGEALVTPWLTVLRFRYDKPQSRKRKTGSLVLTVDSAAAEDLRQLRVALRFSPSVESSTTL